MEKWTLLGNIAEGATSQVVMAVTPKGHKVAVKVLKSSSAAERSALARQVRLLSRLNHPGIVTVEGYGEKSLEILGRERGPCYWMPYVEGRPISEAAKGADAGVVLRWFRECLEALRYVHGQGIVHGDLAPKNILIDSEGRSRLIDFSVLPGDSAVDDIATLPYMAPERIEGRNLAASDLFSIGTIFYECLAGRHPRAGCRTIRELIDCAPQALTKIAPTMVDHDIEPRLIDRMLRARLEERPSDAEKILEIIDQRSWDDTTAATMPFHPIFMIGAETAFAKVENVLSEIGPGSSAVFGVHGGSGVGKSRFIREAGVEAALKGIPVEYHQDLHHASHDELGHLLTSLQSPHGRRLVLLEWNNDRLQENNRHFLSEILAAKLAVEIELKNLTLPDLKRLLALFLDENSVAAAADRILAFTHGNPARILKTLQDVASAGMIHGKSLSAGWAEALKEFSSPEETFEARLKGMTGGPLGPAVRQVVEDLRNDGRLAEAVDLVGLGLKLVEDPAECSRLLRLKINLLSEQGRFEATLEILDRWRSLQSNDEPLPVKTAKYWLISGISLQNLGRHAEAVDRFQHGLEEGAAHWDDKAVRPYLVRAKSLLGLSELKLGNTARAIKILEEGLSHPEVVGIRRAEICRNLAAGLAQTGEMTRVSPLLEEAKVLYRHDGRYDGEFSTCLQEGNLDLSHNDPMKARAAYAQAEAIAKKINSSSSLATVWNNQGLLDRLSGNLARARDLLIRAHEVLRFLGNPSDLEINRRDLAIAEAAVGRFDRASELTNRLTDVSSRDVVTERIRELRDLATPSLTGEPPKDLAHHWNREEALRWMSQQGGPEDEIRKTLGQMRDSLPQELQATFSARGDVKRWALQAAQPSGVSPKSEPRPRTFLSTLSSLNAALLKEEDMDRVLEQLMDVAMAMAVAESGFVVLRTSGDSAPDSPLPGYAVRVARNVSAEDLQTDLFAFSLSAVRRALQTGETVVTDNALVDPLFREARSVHLRGLRSIIALPITGQEGILGVFYLDHRFQVKLFEGELLEALKAFAGIAALALQKGVMIEALRKSQSDLEVRFEVQSRELKRSRLALKNEYGEIVGRSPKMIDVLSMVDRITDAKIPVWIFGESGTGKEAIARALHVNSRRSKKPFVTENCSALPESLLESELFGHKKGAFTHAIADKKGILQYADGGTVFLDEVADMSVAMQSKLLRFLQEGDVRPIGSHDVIHVDVRVVSASNKDLPQLVREGTFREDLFYRLNGVTVRLPPLRDRIEDVPLLVEHFLKRIAEREKTSPCHLDPSALSVFMRYPWPGNIRELQNTLETAVLFAVKNVISPTSMQFKPGLFERAEPKRSASASPVVPIEAIDPILEKTLLAIRDNCFHKGMAAQSLGISRRALYGRLQKFGILTDLVSIRAAIERYFR